MECSPAMLNARERLPELSCTDCLDPWQDWIRAHGAELKYIDTKPLDEPGPRVDTDKWLPAHEVTLQKQEVYFDHLRSKHNRNP